METGQDESMLKLINFEQASKKLQERFSGLIDYPQNLAVANMTTTKLKKIILAMVQVEV